MKSHTIFSKRTGEPIGTYDSESTGGALNVMARDMGFADYADLRETVPNFGRDELEIFELTEELV